MSKVVCFGEVLWDVFPTHKKIGGAPLNVANRLSSFGHNVTMISALGEDNYGQKIIEYLKENKVKTNHIQINKEFQTGKVNVLIDKKGSASYTINYPSAWDKIYFTEKAKSEVVNADAFVFGSLIARDETSRNTLYELIEAAKYKIFDLNLRQPHYTTDVLQYLMEKADFIKFNDDELYEVCKKIGSKYNSLEQNINFIADKTNTKHICVTKGHHGAVLLYNDVLYYNSGYQINVKDTVGAGDSFLASLTSELLNKSTPQKAINFACAIGALVAQNEGANPKILQSEIETFINP
ncbi:carbohydrate kinase [Polaribacter reichenbachii]|uniref:Carbohydrate kinase n=1 Tax=Polaribacter reichenbachii TaxID=996801 RepID=A0A1B8U7A2_9FLAO|nr:carbohydrate kinase [Polaribacter reichenbachii]APZ46338.1 carbohydrate kinase [Polaribacter reichenbachii]AUC20202.1 carbohydrate kinase [Polaribacter reichenbachii]OBY67707.1 carbohydrate kinase [Polaribacter reichenbachii]